MDASINPALRVTSALDRRGLAALAAGLLVLVGIVASSAWQSASNVAALARVNAIEEVGSTLQKVLLTVEDAETGQRGFLLTGRDDYLAPFERAQAALPGLLSQLGRRLGSDTAIPGLNQAIAAKLAELQQTTDLMRANDRAAAMAIVLTDAGRDDMTRIREITAAAVRDQQAELARQSAAIEFGGQMLIAIDLLGLVLVLGLAVVISLGLRAYLAAISQARAEATEAYAALARNNDRLDETVRVRTADLTLANQEIQRFAYIVSHDLRAPLVNIMGFTSELEQSAHTLTDFARAADWPAPVQAAAAEDIPEALRFIKAATGKMDRLINAILKLSREGRRNLTAEPLDMGRLLENLVASMRHQAKMGDVDVTVGPMPVLQADRIAVEQVFGNVIENALKYLQPGRPGVIGITAEPDGPHVRFAVTDNGRGIAARDFERIFELFRRSGDQRVPGEGIGLAHVRALVRRLGGRIDCASTLDLGTTFTITLPIQGSTSREGMA